MGARFGVLGAITVWRDGAPVDVGHARQRLVLAALAVDAGRVVPTGLLVDRVWGVSVPRRGREALYAYVSRLRQALTGTGAELVREQGGYRLAAETTAVDVLRFRETAGRARAADSGEDAAALWETALGLWRGEAFAGADTPWFNAQRSVLEAERFTGQLDLMDVRLRLGQHSRALPELAARADAHPLDERVAGQLMLALYRCGRQTEALEHHERIRRRLAEETGLDPSPPLVRLRQQILTADPALDRAPATGGAAPRRRPQPVPQQLPAPPVTFVGRERELAALDDLCGAAAGDGTLDIAAITGVGGVGKTWLALRWAHRHLSRFPDGQLYVNLRGFAPAAGPVPAPVAVRGFLGALGVDPQEMPADPDAQAGLYRSLVAGRRMLIMLDNARDADQVRSLLPGSGGCVVLVTSRDRLTGLIAANGARPCAVDPLTDGEARLLLERHLRRVRRTDDPMAFDAIAAACAGLPLALAVVAARVAVTPRFPLRTLAAELHDTQLGLDAFSGGDTATDVRAVFSWSYHALGTDAARLFRLLGVHPGPDVSLPGAAGVAGLPVPRVRALLAELSRVHLVGEVTPGRYALHDLLRAYAGELAHTVDPEADRRAARHRVVEHYLHTADRAAGLLDPHRDPVPLPPAVPGAGPQEMADQAAALGWFTAEHAVLLGVVDLAAGAGLDAGAWRLARNLETYFDYRGHWHDWAAVQHIALGAAQRLGDPAWRAGAHRGLGNCHTQMGRLDEGHRHFRHALDLYERLGDPIRQAHVHRGLGWVCGRLGRHRDALGHNERALTLYRQAGHRAGEALALNNVGWVHAVQGDYRQTLDYCAQAVSVNQEIDDGHAEAGAWDSLGYAHHHLAEYPAAVKCYARALRLVRGFGDRYNETEVLNHLGDTQLAAGDLDAARAARCHALEIALEIGHPDTDELRAKRDELDRARPHRPVAPHPAVR
ncbi:BTAD domain-containing putative transcriptional regulator [Streptomyces sp. NPDC094472]|uniref:AfsR/SARP family transcriptional regulator n=1 Tax=unclassified Streptomyces TaxID=2593676 RepID=UPI003327182D